MPTPETMPPISTLPELHPFDCWCRHPGAAWESLRMLQVVIANANRSLTGQPPLETGEPAPGETVWTGDGFAVYQP